MLSRLADFLPHPLSAWVAHARNRASHLETRRDVTHVGEEIRDALDRMDDPPDIQPPRPAETGPEYRYTLRDFDRLDCIFVHVPKAAGISLATALFGHLGGGHRTVREYRRIFGWDFDRYFVFTVVRNPFSRLVSAWRFMRGELPIFRLNRHYRDTVLARYDGFGDFVRSELETAAAERVAFRPQTHFLCADGRLDVDYVGKVETLQRDFERIRDELDVDASLSHRNRSPGPRRPVESWFTDQTADIARSVYERDFDVLGYGREVPGRV